MADTGRIIDMSTLPAPQVVRQYAYEEILAALKTDFLIYYPDAAQALAFESDPLNKWFERIAYQMMLLRQQQNEDAQGVMLAYAAGSDLDQLGAIYQVQRLVITAADDTTTPPTPAVMEGDAALRERIQMAPQGFSVAGPIGAYMFFARSASGAVKDARPSSPEPGQVLVTVLSHEGDGSASSELLAVVNAAINDEDVRPLTDEVTVQSADIVHYEIKAVIYTDTGPDTGIVMDTVQESTASYTEAMRKVSLSVPISGIYAALHLSGVSKVELLEPTGDVTVGPYQAAYCDNITLTQANSQAGTQASAGSTGSNSGDSDAG